MSTHVIHATKERWSSLLERMGLANDNGTYQKLYEAHLEQHRHYHTIGHLDACLKHLDLVTDFADQPDEIEIAIWFHDAVYQPYSAGNEKKCAAWATEFLQKSESFVTLQERVEELIMATEHNASGIANDQTLIIDIDHSILGQSASNYDLYENAIRKEFKRTPYNLYRQKRTELLQGLLNREKIYNSDFFYGQLELNARENLERAIAKLS